LRALRRGRRLRSGPRSACRRLARAGSASARTRDDRRLSTMMRGAIAALSLAFLADVATADVLDRPWYENRAAHAVAFSDQPEHDVAQAIADLELFRTVVYKVTNAHEGNEVIPVELLLFNDGDDFHATVKDPHILGYMRGELRKQYLVTSRGVIGMD